MGDPRFARGANSPRGGGANLLYGIIIAENCMNMKTIGLHYPRAPRSANGSWPMH